MGAVSDFSSIPSPGTPPTTGRMRDVPVDFQLPSSTDFSTPSQLKETVEKQLNNSPVPQLEKRKKIFYAAAAVAAVVAIVGACVVAWPLAGLLILSATFLAQAYLTKQKIADEKETLLAGLKEGVRKDNLSTAERLGLSSKLPKNHNFRKVLQRWEKDYKKTVAKSPDHASLMKSLEELERQKNRHFTALFTKKLPTKSELVKLTDQAISSYYYGLFEQVFVDYKTHILDVDEKDLDKDDKALLAEIEAGFARLGTAKDELAVGVKISSIKTNIQTWIDTHKTDNPTQ